MKRLKKELKWYWDNKEPIAILGLLVLLGVILLIVLELLIELITTTI